MSSDMKRRCDKCSSASLPKKKRPSEQNGGLEFHPHPSLPSFSPSTASNPYGPPSHATTEQALKSSEKSQDISECDVFIYTVLTPHLNNAVLCSDVVHIGSNSRNRLELLTTT